MLLGLWGVGGGGLCEIYKKKALRNTWMGLVMIDHSIQQI